MKTPLKRVPSRIRQSVNSRRQRTSESASPSLEELGLAHLNETERIGLRDDVLRGFYQNRTNEVYTGVSISPDDIVVDVGCGAGGPLQFLSTRGAKVTAVDVSEEAIAVARDAVNSKGGIVDFVLAPTQVIPLPDNYATRVVCMEVLEHVDNPTFSLSEMFRIGQHGALYLLTVPDEIAERIIGGVARPEYFEKPNHIRIIGRDEFEDLVRASGLEILKHEYNGFVSTIRLAILMMRGHTDLKVEDEYLLKWGRMWNELLDSPEGREMKDMLDYLVPRSQIIVARKP